MESAVKYLVGVLSTSPVKDVYLVPGNNDVIREEPEGKAVEAAQIFWSRVQKGLEGTGVKLHDLSTCYFGTGLTSGCYTDVAGTSYRIVGFPSHSFKEGADEARSTVQQAQIDRLWGLVGQAAKEAKRVLILTHIAELDDPHALAHNEMELAWELADAEDKATRASDRPTWATASPWNAKKVVFEKWKGVVDSRNVAGVLAGHFHDSHKEIYRPPYDWATTSADRASLDKLYLAPPLSMRYQVDSPIQARGFALFRLNGDQDPERQLFWYDRQAKLFEPDVAERQGGLPPETQGGLVISGGVAGVMKNLWDSAYDEKRLARLAVFAIAFLAAFLTVAQLWEVPPPNTRAAAATATSPVGGAATTTTTTTTSSSSGSSTTATQSTGTQVQGANTLLFSSNFARTVMSGLAGLALVSTFDGLWEKQGIQEKPYFLVLFVVFFLLILATIALLRGSTEALRSRVSLSRRYPRRQQGTGYYLHRAWSWFTSLRIPVLIFADTVFNVILGRNQLKTAEFENELARLHESIVLAVDRIRKEIDDTIQNSINRRRAMAPGAGAQGAQGGGGAAAPAAPAKHDSHLNPDVRVSISILTQDEGALYYVSREKGSVAHGFGHGSMAWIAVQTGRPLWWRKSYEKCQDKIVLIDNDFLAPGSRELRYPALAAGKLLLRDYVQWRGKADYEAFIVLPLPWLHRDPDGDLRKAGIHISFKHEDDLKLLWNSLGDLPQATAPAAPPTGTPATAAPTDFLRPYEDCDDLLRHMESPGSSPSLRSEKVEEVLTRNIPLLTDLLSRFNDVIFEEYVRPRLRPQ